MAVDQPEATVYDCVIRAEGRVVRGPASNGYYRVVYDNHRRRMCEGDFHISELLVVLGEW